MSNGDGPCGACKFLRRKCVRGCIFAPYFDSEQGTVHFAAVHRVFGASNASKLLQLIPAHRRRDAVVTLCYEALARVRDPVYGCVGHIFTLQRQVVSLQAELAFVKARLETLQSLPTVATRSDEPAKASPPSPKLMSMHSDQLQVLQQQLAPKLTSNVSYDEEFDGGDVQAIAREFVSRYLLGVRTKPTLPP